MLDPGQGKAIGPRKEGVGGQAFVFDLDGTLVGREPEGVVVVGDSVWDLLAARRARSLGVGVLSGGYGLEELERAGAYRVYEDPADLLRYLDEVGVRVPSL